MPTNPLIRRLARGALRSATSALASGYGPLDDRVMRTRFSDRRLPVTLATITGSRDLAQATAGLISFYSKVGRPQRLVVADDGTLSEDDRRVLSMFGEDVTVFTASNPADPPLSEEVARYASSTPLGKKLAMLISLTGSADLPVVYMDSDVLFFNESDGVARLLGEPGFPPRYMSDPNGSAFDSRLDRNGLDPVNSGFLLLPVGFSWDAALSRCQVALDEPEWYTEQTVVLFAMHANGGEPLPVDQYVLRWEDRRSLRDVASKPGVVARHYVSPVRWKLWIRAYGGYGAAAAGALRGEWRLARRP